MTKLAFDDLPPDAQERLVRDYPDLAPLVPRQAAAPVAEPPLYGRPNRLLLAAAIGCLAVGWTLAQLSAALLWAYRQLQTWAYALPRPLPEIVRPRAAGQDRTVVRAARSAYGLTPRFRRMP